MGTQVSQPKSAQKQNASRSTPGGSPVQAGMVSESVLGAGRLLQRMEKLSIKPSTSDILYLQRTIGNSAVSNLLQRNSSRGQQSEETIGAQGGMVDGATTQAIERAKGGGSAVPQGIAADVQRQIGVDVSHARIHTGQRAEVLNRKLSAEAFTHGRDVFFGKDAYKPSAPSGKQLLAHELTHVAQQTGASANHIQPKLRVGPAHDHFEAQAERVAKSFATPPAKSADKPFATGNAMVQRTLKFKSMDLGGEVSTRAKRAGKLGFESTFSKIKRTLDLYEQAGSDIRLQYSLLRKLNALIDQWFKKADRKNDYDVNDGNKGNSLHKLKQEVVREVAKLKDKTESEDFLKEYGVGSEKSNRFKLAAAEDSEHALGKKIHQLDKNNIPLPASGGDLKISDGLGGEKGTMAPKFQWNIARDKYRSEKHLGLSPKDRMAINMYTADQFAYMNPAMANNEAWFQGTMDDKLKDDPKNNKKWRKEAMQENKKIGGHLVQALDKLPNWKQTKAIYRGESITEEEAKAFKVGSVKKFPFFVSTSRDTGTPIALMKKNTSKTRPWGVLYYIQSSKSGKNVAPWSLHKGEEEILFPPNISFRVTKVRMLDETSRRVDLDVVQI